MKPDYPMDPSLMDFALREHLPDPRKHHGEFVDYWLSRGEMKADWVATERNWLRLLRDKGKPPIARPRPKLVPHQKETEPLELFDPEIPHKVTALIRELVQKKGPS